MTAHLLLSTIVLAIAIVLARVLPLTARTRYALLLAGLAKFAIPTAAIAWLLRAIGLEPPPVAIAIPARVFIGGGTAATTSASIDWIAFAWAAVALLILGRWMILRTRTIAAALRNCSAPIAREIEALDSARRALRITTPVDLVRSPICEAPAVLRVVRPVIVLPTHACDALDDDELRTLLLHECAHIARRDNLVSMFETLAGALLWFHPLVWLALRDLAVAREEACDEAVSDAAQPDVYLHALTKICRAVLASRTAGASCMASARLNERIEHLMNYTRIKTRALSHRAVLSAAVAAILVITTAATALSVEKKRATLPSLYSLDFSVTPKDDRVTFAIDVIDRATGKVVASPKVDAKAGEWSNVDVKNGPHDIALRVQGMSDGSATLFITVKQAGEDVQRNLVTYTPKGEEQKKKDNQKFTGAPISLNLKDADIRDVMKTFSELTGLDIVVADDVQGRVTVAAQSVPWDEMLQRIADENGLKIEIDGKTIRVTKKK